MTYLQPVNNRITLRLVKEKPKPNSLLLPESAQASQKDPVYEVLAVGCGKHTSTGELIPMPVKQGDHVIIDPYGAKAVKVDSDQVIICCKSEDIIGIINLN